MSSTVSARALLAGLALFGLGVFGTPAAAQDAGRVTGTVMNATNMRPLDGAQVELEGTGMGALANAQGRFLILNVPAGTYTVRVTMIGYSTDRQEVTVQAGGTANADFQLEETALALDEIVVTGTAAEVRAKEVGNSLDAITSREIQDIPLRNPEDILGGRAPGVTVMTNSGQPGAGGTVKIRGVNSVSQDAQPLIYVDGVRIFNEPISGGWDSRTGVSPLQDIAADDIERIEVIKGAAATTLYGTEASSGVIQIFTKQGVAGEPLWNAEIGLGLSQMGNFGPDDSQLFSKCDRTYEGMDLTDADDDGRIDDRVTWTDPTCPSNGNWFDTGLQQSYNLSVRGGLGDLTYFLSGNFSDNEGTLPTGRAKDGGFRGNFGFSPAENLRLRLNTAYTKRDVRWVNDGNNADGFLLNVGRGYRGYLKGGKDAVAEECTAILNSGTNYCSTNGYLFDAELTTDTDRFTTGLTIEYDPWESITNRFTVGWDYTRSSSVSFFPFGYLDDPGGYFWDEALRHTKLSLDYAGSWEADFTSDIASTFSWGGQIFRDRHRWTELDVSGFAGPGDPTWDSGSGAPDYWSDYPFAETNAGFFLQEIVGFQDRLFITGGLRVDGNSAFGDDFGLQAYPKVSASYVLSDYDFWPTDWFETFKLRGAIGESGKAPGTFAKLRTWSPVTGF
ncbi:MAG: TonB-dependent receptor, partial [Gemmatimonadota bacterium]